MTSANEILKALRICFTVMCCMAILHGAVGVILLLTVNSLNTYPPVLTIPIDLGYMAGLLGLVFLIIVRIQPLVKPWYFLLSSLGILVTITPLLTLALWVLFSQPGLYEEWFFEKPRTVGMNVMTFMPNTVVMLALLHNLYLIALIGFGVAIIRFYFKWKQQQELTGLEEVLDTIRLPDDD
jgi:hypothetical protein